jgi:hypothetical protein
MVIRYICSLGILAIFSCTSSHNVTPTLPEIDFSSSNYFAPKDIYGFKLGVECTETPYWDNRTVKLQGFVFSGNIDVKAKKFFLYDNIKVFESTNQFMSVHYQSKDSAIISKALLDNSDKHCLIKVRCVTWENYIFECKKGIQFTIIKPEDLEFK